MAAKRQTREINLDPEVGAGSLPQKTATLEPGGWYAAAFDTSPIPASLALDTIEERLTTELKVGTLRLWSNLADVDPVVPAAVRNATGANVWAFGQYVGTTPLKEVSLPSQVVAFARVSDASIVPGVDKAPVPADKHAAEKDAGPSTVVLIGAVVGVTVIVGGGIALLWWMRKKKKKRENGKRRKHRK
jgi:hypothetical protein